MKDQSIISWYRISQFTILIWMNLWIK